MTKKSSKVPLNERIRYQLGIMRKQGLITYAKGFVIRLYYIRLSKKYGFSRWHVMPCELQPYATDIVKAINAMPGSRNFTVCEIGCGLGNIIRNIKAEHKYGYDINPNVIDCAKHLRGGVRFSVGSFEGAAKELPVSIDVLIVVDWIHVLPSEEVKRLFDILLGAVEVKCIVTDSVDDARKRQHPSLYQHNLGEIFPEYTSRYLTEYDYDRVYILEKKSKYSCRST